MKIILASNSPRRKELLTNYNIEFDIIPSNVMEQIDNTLTPYENVMNLAKLKAMDVFENNKTRMVLAADTIVIYNNEILGKPINIEDARRMLRMLSGNTHEVATGVAFVKDGVLNVGYEVSKVTFKELSDSDIEWYIETKEPMDKAGSYAIQGIGSKFIESYEGEFDNIVGLPMKLVSKFLNTK